MLLPTCFHVKGNFQKVKNKGNFQKVQKREIVLGEKVKRRETREKGENHRLLPRSMFQKRSANERFGPLSDCEIRTAVRI